MATPLDPIPVFLRHLKAARRGTREESSDAMTLSTIAAGGRPKSRIVLLRGADRRGFVFFTNFQSAKGREIERSDRVALCVHWPHMTIQVRIEGRAKPVSKAEADAYFASRPRESQIAAWASDQSRPIASRQELVRRFAREQKRFLGCTVPRPPHWSGFRVTPDLVEFWYGRPHRLHDRHLYIRKGKAWKHSLLSP
jgi:pyridoxamine 5'-phosphate oxidase